MRTTQGSRIKIGECFLANQVNDGKRMIPPASVNGHIGRFPIGGGNDFMRVRPDGGTRYDLQRDRIDDRQGVVLF